VVALDVQVLGGFRVSLDGRAVDDAAWHRRRPAALVKLLALAAGHRLHREQVVDALWPEFGPEAGAANLRKAVFHARRALSAVEGAELIGSASDLLWLGGEPLRVDLDDFRHSVAAGRRARDAAEYQRALDLYGDGLLPGDCYEDWAASESEVVRREFVAAVEELAGLREAAGELEPALELVRRLVSVDPLREDNHVTLIRLNALAGRRSEALRAYEVLRSTLADELGAEPGAAAQRLFEEVRSRHTLEPELGADLWERVGDLRMLAGDPVGAAKGYDKARSSGAAPAADARIQRKTADARLMGHRPDLAVVHLAAAEASAVDPGERARLVRTRANYYWEIGDIPAAQRYAERARDKAVADGSPEDVASAQEALAIVSHLMGEWRDGLATELDRLASAEVGSSQLARVFDIHHCIGQYHLYGDGLADSVEGYARRILDRAEEAGAVRAQAFAWCLLGESLLLQARWDESAGCLERSSALHASLGSRSGALAWQRRAEVEVCRGEHERAESYLRRAAAIATVSAMASHLWGRIYATRALSALEVGEPNRAVEAVRCAAAMSARYGDCPSCSALLNPVAAEAFVALGDPDEAVPYVGSAARVGAMFASSAWQAMAESAAGSLARAQGRADEARARFHTAADLYARAGQPYWAQRARRGNAQGTHRS
jgi:DNA-binding SARP family transcriptional activator